MSQKLFIELHRTGVTDSEKFVYSCHFGNVVRFPFLFFFHHEKIYRIVLRFCQLLIKQIDQLHFALNNHGDPSRFA